MKPLLMRSSSLRRISAPLLIFLGMTGTAAVSAQQSAPTMVASNGSGSVQNVAENVVSNCGDAVSDALGQTGSGMPCWSDIRTVDHWNTLNLGREMNVSGDQSLRLPGTAPSEFTYTLGALSGLVYQDPANAQGYTGVGAVSGFVRQRKWQMMFEDGGSLGDFHIASDDTFVGLNRAALRATGSVATRWSWQGSATNTYGNDVLRTLGPLDYRRVGDSQAGSAEAPVVDVVAYGLHSGNLTDQQEDFKLDDQESRRTSLGFSVAHTFRHYEDDRFTGETYRARAEALHSLSQNAALGIFATANRQSGIARCSLAGLGAVGLAQWGSRTSVSLSGSLDGASNTCGKRVQSLGDLAVYMRAAPKTDFFITANRDLSGGIVEQAVLLNSASAGIQQTYRSGATLRLSGAAIHYNDIITNVPHTGSFAEADAVLPLGRTLLEETSYRHYQISSLPIQDNRNVLTFTVWWSPKRTEPELVAHR